MNRLKTYIIESYEELTNKVTWPTFKEVQSSALVVLVSTLIIAIIVWFMDFGSSYTLKQFYKLFN